ncbi:MAG: DapH/DapD/GlmU-related protein [bacterium]
MRTVCKWYQLSRRLYLAKIPVLPKIIKRCIRIVFSCDLPFTAEIDRGVEFAHSGLGVVIHSKAIIGSGTVIYQNVTIGGNGKSEELNGIPVIGKHVFIGAGAVILGPVTIGDYAKVGANAVVLHSIPAHAVAVGVPARIIKMNALHSDSEN